VANEILIVDDSASMRQMISYTLSGSDERSEGKDTGATGWLVKPFNPDTLVATVKKVIS